MGRTRKEQLRLFLRLLLIVTLCFIWGNSLLSRESSSALSGRVAAWLRSIGIPVGEHFLRKLAHFTEFGILGCEITLLLRLKGFPNVVLRDSSDRIEGADLDWCYSVNPPKDGGRALVADLTKSGWRPSVRFEGLPPHVFAEYRRLPSGGMAVHLLNYDPAHRVEGAKMFLPAGMTATVEEPFGETAAKVAVGPDGALPSFGMYAVVTVMMK